MKVNTYPDTIPWNIYPNSTEEEKPIPKKSKLDLMEA
jgi:hypothetical protein